MLHPTICIPIISYNNSFKYNSPSILCFMCSNYRKEIIPPEKLAACCVTSDNMKARQQKVLV